MATDEKSKVPQEFDRVARAYDLLSSLNPGYEKHLAWSARRMEMPAQGHALDLCCGTGISTMALRTAHPQAHLTGLDASSEMLARARAKPEMREVRWLHGDAMDPASSGATGPYDGILMAYGIRNVVDPDLCLKRLFDLLEPGGILALHEYSLSASLRSRLLWQIVTLGIVIPLGAILARSTAIFRYLRRSVMEFDSVAELEARLGRAGFVDVRTEAMDGWQRGIVHTFLARRPTS